MKLRDASTPLMFKGLKPLFGVRRGEVLDSAQKADLDRPFQSALEKPPKNARHPRICIGLVVEHAPMNAIRDSSQGRFEKSEAASYTLSVSYAMTRRCPSNQRRDVFDLAANHVCSLS
jgi:hypothetical protein